MAPRWIYYGNYCHVWKAIGKLKTVSPNEVKVVSLVFVDEFAHSICNSIINRVCFISHDIWKTSRKGISIQEYTYYDIWYNGHSTQQCNKKTCYTALSCYVLLIMKGFFCMHLIHNLFSI